MIRIVEVGPRDGLQSEAVAVPTDVKVAYVDALSSAKLPEIEVSAFVSPRWVPQLADAEEVFKRIRREPGVLYSALVATDAPLLPHQLKRIARRVGMGLGKLGSWAGNGSGDLFLAVSTANPGAGAADQSFDGQA